MDGLGVVLLFVLFVDNDLCLGWLVCFFFDLCLIFVFYYFGISL